MKTELYALHQILFEQGTALMTPNTATPIPQILFTANAVRHGMANGMLACSGKDQAIRYIRYHQNAIISMQDALVAAMPPGEWPALYAPGMQDSASSWTAQAYHQLDQLLEYLQQHFAGYLDTEVHMPVAAQWNMASHLQPMLELLQEWMATHAIHPELQEALINIFARYTRRDESTKITYQRMHYVHLLMTKLMQLISKQHARPQLALQELLHYYNLNSVSMFLHYRKRVQHKIAGKPDMEQQLETLALILKRSNQCLVHPQFAYAPSLPSLQDRVRAWLTDEITYLETLKQVDTPYETTSEEGLPVDSRIVFDMTAAELGCLIRLGDLAGVFKTSNITSMLKTASQAYATVQNPTLDAEALRTAFYNIKATTLQATLTRLDRMALEGRKKLRELKKKTETTI